MQNELTPTQAYDLSQRIESLAKFHSRHLSEEASRHWFDQLRPFYGESLTAVLTAAKNEKTMPSLGSVLESVKTMAARAQKPTPLTLQPLTIEQRERADLARKKSGLWLHYTRHVSGALLSVFGLGTEEALAQAKREYDEHTIRAWMEMRERLEVEDAQPPREVSASWSDLL